MNSLHKKLIRTIAGGNEKQVPCHWLGEMQNNELVFTRYKSQEPGEKLNLSQWQKAVLINSDPAKCDTLVIHPDDLPLINFEREKPLIVAVMNPLQTLKNFIKLTL